MKIWCDGGNPKQGKYCVVTERGKIIRGKEKGCTNNELEYKAMIKALEIAKDGDVIYSDSKLVVNQLLGWWRINNETLLELCEMCKEISKNKKVKIVWIPRRRNRAGKILESQKLKIGR